MKARLTGQSDIRDHTNPIDDEICLQGFAVRLLHTGYFSLVANQSVDALVEVERDAAFPMGILKNLGHFLGNSASHGTLAHVDNMDIRALNGDGGELQAYEASSDNNNIPRRFDGWR